MTSDRGPASAKILEHSSSSTLKVEAWPKSRSYAPIRVLMASTGEMLRKTTSESVRLSPTRAGQRVETTHVAEAAGTYMPSWAMMTPAAVVRRRVDFPAMFLCGGRVTSARPGDARVVGEAAHGPVKSTILAWSPPISTSFGIKSARRHMAGCRRLSNLTSAWSDSTNVGRHLLHAREHSEREASDDAAEEAGCSGRHSRLVELL